MTEVFADAFYYIALLNSSDRFHAAAVQATQSLGSSLVTTGWVLMKVADALSSPAVRRRTHQFLQQVIVDANTRVVVEHLPWFDRGMRLYGNRLDKSWSLTDCISFEVMAERGIVEALTGDHHFVQAGFRALRLPLPSNP
jgi:predicted nucleic acid-binding protein